MKATKDAWLAACNVAKIKAQRCHTSAGWPARAVDRSTHTLIATLKHQGTRSERTAAALGIQPNALPEALIPCAYHGRGSIS